MFDRGGKLFSNGGNKMGIMYYVSGSNFLWGNYFQKMGEIHKL